MTSKKICPKCRTEFHTPSEHICNKCGTSLVLEKVPEHSRKSGNMITTCCNKPVPPEAEKDVIMPCGKCCFCCDHTHIMGHTFPRGTDLTEAFTQILNGDVLAETTGIEQKKDEEFSFENMEEAIREIRTKYGDAPHEVTVSLEFYGKLSALTIGDRRVTTNLKNGESTIYGIKITIDTNQKEDWKMVTPLTEDRQAEADADAEGEYDIAAAEAQAQAEEEDRSHDEEMSHQHEEFDGPPEEW